MFWWYLVIYSFVLHQSKLIFKERDKTHTHQDSVCMFQGKIDEALQLIQNADPTGETQTDSTEMLRLENQCSRMGPLIDTELEKIDKSVCYVVIMHVYYDCVIIRVLWWLLFCGFRGCLLPMSQQLQCFMNSNIFFFIHIREYMNKVFTFTKV